MFPSPHLRGTQRILGGFRFDLNCRRYPSQETEVTSTPTKPVDNVVIATKGLQDRNTNITAGTTVENKGKWII